MVTWIVVVAGLLLWIGVAAWRASVFIGKDMVETWGSENEYDQTTYGELVRAGVTHGLCWPFILTGFLFMAACRGIAKLLWAWAYHYARNIHEATQGQAAPPAEYVPNEELLVTDELAKVTDDDDPIAQPTRLQVRLAAEAEEARQEYLARRLHDETAIGSIPAYEPRRAAPDE